MPIAMSFIVAKEAAWPPSKLLLHCRASFPRARAYITNGSGLTCGRSRRTWCSSGGGRTADTPVLPKTCPPRFGMPTLGAADFRLFPAGSCRPGHGDLIEPLPFTEVLRWIRHTAS
jgi:hypothetical protein